VLTPKSQPDSSREQLTNGKKGGTLYICIYEELPHTKNIFTEVIFQFILTYAFVEGFFNAAHKYIPV